ncbi:hypothetical protein [Dietzia sp. 179-F 9C3 NHS]|uniref:hypothetical protein n=1 Tax=Dietzia sp. 179-F 9C3 NHS TaxID=3374295 RepID=UPI00387A2560
MLAVSGAVAMAAAPVVGAQIPGDNPRTWVFPVDDTRIQLAVDAPDLETGQVNVTMQNNTGQNLTCQGLDGTAAATVTTAEVVARSVDFYTHYPHSEFADLNVRASVLFTTIDEDIPLGSVVDMVPGSAAGMINPEWGALGEINREFADARLAGRYGPMANSITIPAQTAQQASVQLHRPSAGTWQDFQTGVFATCVIDGQRYVFHAYQDDQRPDLAATDETTGSLGSAAIGSGS